MTDTHTQTHTGPKGSELADLAPPSPLWLTFGLVLHADQYSDKDCYDNEEDDHHDNSHHHPNDDCSLHTAWAWSVWRRWRRRGRWWNWRKRYKWSIPQCTVSPVCLEHLESLSVQTKLLDVVQLEQQTHVWSRIMFSLPAGQMSFLIRAGVDCLPSPVNLCRWKIQCDPSCPLCRTQPCTVRHVLSCCPTALNQELYTWRHDSILAHLTQLLKLHFPYGTTLYADLPGLRASENPTATIPTSVATTTARPDIVIIQNNRITLLELTVPMNTQEGLHARRPAHGSNWNRTI